MKVDPFWSGVAFGACGGVLIALAALIGLVYRAQRVLPFEAGRPVGGGGGVLWKVVFVLNWVRSRLWLAWEGWSWLSFAVGVAVGGVGLLALLRFALEAP